MGSYFEIFILIAQVKTLFSQPLSTVFKAQLLEISLDFSKHGELFRKIQTYFKELNGLFTTLSTVFKKQLLSNKR